MKEIKENILSVGANDLQRELFDELIPLPDGTSYNSYLIKGNEKTALIDTVDPTKKDILLNNLKEVQKIDYIVANHAEQDHSGTIPDVLLKYPQAKVVCSEKCKNMLIDLLHISEDKFIVVKDNEEISLGDKTLQFIFTPWVHWPETIATYLKEDNILFSCDFFGSHFATEDLEIKDKEVIYESAKRYYAEIMMPFRQMIKKNIGAIKNLKIDIIAPSHGPIYHEPSFITDAYKDWVSDDVKNEVVLVYVSMHGSTKIMADHLRKSLEDKGVSVKFFNLIGVDIGKLAIALVDAATIVIGSPTVLIGAHPNAIHAAALVNALKPKVRFLSIIGSLGWGGKMVDQLASLIPNLKVEVIPPVLIKGLPRKEDFKKLDELAEQIVEKHKTI